MQNTGRRGFVIAAYCQKWKESLYHALAHSLPFLSAASLMPVTFQVNNVQGSPKVLKSAKNWVSIFHFLGEVTDEIQSTLPCKYVFHKMSRPEGGTAKRWECFPGERERVGWTRDTTFWGGVVCHKILRAMQRQEYEPVHVFLESKLFFPTILK